MALLPPLKSMFDAQRAARPMPTDIAPDQLRASMHAIIEESFFALSTPQAPAKVEQDLKISVTGGEIGE